MIDLYLSVLPVIGGCILLLWIISLATKKVSFVDTFWGAGFVIVAWTAVLGGGGFGDLTPVQKLIVAMVTLWGLRLALHLGIRFMHEGEDRRYVRMMKDLSGIRWALKALLYVFTMQSILILIVSSPILYVLSNPDLEYGPLAWVAAALWLFGFLFESVADAQLKSFKSNPDNKGKVLDTGVWGWSRHPNYFGETVLWWGIWLVAANPWTLISPVFVTFTLLKWSGVPLSEAGMKKTRTGYSDYQERVSSFFPKPPRAD